MAAIVPACDIPSLIKLAKCYACFSDNERLAATVYWLEQRRAQLAGQTPLSANQLRKNAACLCYVDEYGDPMDAAVAQQGAQAAGVVAATGISNAAIRQALLPFSQMSLTDMRRIEILTKCALTAFP